MKITVSHNRLWFTLPGRPAVAVGVEGESISESDAETRASAYWSAADRVAAIETELCAECPHQQLYRSWLPAPDVAWDGPEGEYVYTLRSRRRRGKYQVASYRRL